MSENPLVVLARLGDVYDTLVVWAAPAEERTIDHLLIEQTIMQLVAPLVTALEAVVYRLDADMDCDSDVQAAALEMRDRFMKLTEAGHGPPELDDGV